MTGHSLILQTTARFLLPLLLLFSIFMLLRGHNEPGGGFIAGLLAAMGITIHLFAFDVREARRVLRVDPRGLLGWGLMAATVSGLFSAFRGQAFFTSQWWPMEVPIFGYIKLSTPLIFDIGVYLVVMGAVLTVVLSLAEAEDEAEEEDLRAKDAARLEAAKAEAAPAGGQAPLSDGGGLNDSARS